MIKFSKIAATSMLSLGLSFPAMAQTVVQVAESQDTFKMLSSAIRSAGLAKTLSGEGPFTVFAPTNKAFAAIPRDQLQAILKDKAKLQRLLAYHVVPGKVMAADVKEGAVKTIQGQAVMISTKDGVKVGGANVVESDIAASNGVIHVIDKVMLPR